MSTWTGTTKNAATWGLQTKNANTTGSGVSIEIGMPIGLLLSLTYAETHAASLSSIWSSSTKNTNSWSLQTKN